MNLVSVSGGKDSTACLTLAVERHGIESVRAVFADTGNEHPLTYDYVDYLERTIGVPIHHIKRDFSQEWEARKVYVRNKWPGKGERTETIERVLAVLDKGPTGIPFLDICIIKGIFPSRKAQFCTQFLKTEPMTEYAMQLIEQHGSIESWQGVRAEESPGRAKLPEREEVGGGLSIYRPILRWTAAQVFEQARKHGIEPNPLYRMGMNRVGCMPCINERKDSLLEIFKRFPDQIDRIEEWESIVASASKRGDSSFFADPDADAHLKKRGIRNMVEWSKTQRGGQMMDWIRVYEEPKACSSAYGLCE